MLYVRKCVSYNYVMMMFGFACQQDVLRIIMYCGATGDGLNLNLLQCVLEIEFKFYHGKILFKKID